MNRGSASSCSNAPTANGRFNEAPIHESGKCVGRYMGRYGQGASMRPRFMNRGSHIEDRLSGRIGRASMRPRFMNRGSAASDVLAAKLLMLQ